MGQSDSVESLVDRIGVLRRERERLREAGASRDELERNRLTIARAQIALSHALVARHHEAA
jgi:hypothetical protein